MPNFIGLLVNFIGLPLHPVQMARICPELRAMTIAVIFWGVRVRCNLPERKGGQEAPLPST